MGTTPGIGSQPSAAEGQGNFRFALVALTSLFFMWGFITSLNTLDSPHI